jgi:5-oxoprolinase (ATP-hydrolysing)
VTFDAVELQILWSRLIHVTEECWQTIWRASFSTVIGEALDFGVELLDPHGASVAHAPRSMPVFHFCLPATVQELLRRFPASELEPGDVLVTNDPWLCAGHLPDIATVSPIFHEGELVALVASVGNAADIGGTRDNGRAQEVHEEGLLLPPLKAWRRYEPVGEVFDILAANVRHPEMVLGDLHAQVAANRVAEQRIGEFLGEYGMRDLRALTHAITSRSEAAVRKAIADVPDGTYSASTWIDGVDEALQLSVDVVVRGDRIRVRYRDVPPEAGRGGINCTRSYTVSHTLYALKLLLIPDVPSNAGNFAPFEVEVPDGTILAARPPASVALRVRTGWHLHELIFAALAPALPDSAQAGSGLACMLTASGSTSDGRSFSDHLFLGGGQGASAADDGIGALIFPTSAGNTSIEMLEQRAPVVVEHKGYADGTGGLGAMRGGRGERFVLRVRDDDGGGARVSVSALPEGLRAAPPGLMGGGPGCGARVLLDGVELPDGGLVELRDGARLEVRTPGGGGYGATTDNDDRSVVA